MFVETPWNRIISDYLRTTLATGHGLARGLLNRDLTQGKLYAMVPGPIAPDLVTQRLSVGGLWKAPFDPDEALADFIVSYLTDIDGSFFVAEHALQRADDLDASCQDSIFFHEEEVYYFAQGGSSRVDVLNCIHHSATVLPEIGVLLRLPQVRLLNRSNVATSTLSTMARVADHILIGAFDGESYLLWFAQ